MWKRFVRVRTDDLESVRVERAIKRTRSDLASHVSPKPAAEPNANGAGNFTEHVDVEKKPEVGVCNFVEVHMQELQGEEDEDGNEAALKEDAAIARAMVEDLSAHGTTPPDSVGPIETALPESSETPAGPTPPSPISKDPTVNGAEAVEEVEVPEVEDPQVSTLVASEIPVGRMQRSQSADPDKSSRLSRVYTSSTGNMDGASSQTGDESSASTTEKRRTARKKRSMSMDPNKKKSQRKVVIDDFEMMRVLGKGCAGKVLLVRHKSTADLYALKAITKRHVLAHQELQHTLTEQAVLKRMAAESKDPFVVKLWWSFHDKENLFLVMVR